MGRDVVGSVDEWRRRGAKDRKDLGRQDESETGGKTLDEMGEEQVWRPAGAEHRLAAGV